MKKLIFYGFLVLLGLISKSRVFARILLPETDIDSSCFDARCKHVNSTWKPCMCDDKCNQYNDCCIDFPKAKSNVSSTIACAQLPDGFYFVNRTCNKLGLKNKCQASANYTVNLRRQKLMDRLPVTDLTTKITYGNVFCARCNKSPDMNIQFWNMSITCQTVNGTITFYNSTRNKFSDDLSGGATNLIFNSTIKSWTVSVGNETENCTLRPKLPTVLKTYVRPCFANAIQSCKPSFSNLTSHCLEYQSVVEDKSGTMYRNRYCAECNEVAQENLTCVIQPSTAFTIDYNYRFPSSGNSHTRIVRVKNRQFLRKLTTFRPSFASPNLPFVPLSSPISKDEKKNYIVMDFKSDCATFLNSANFSKVVAEIVHYNTFSRTYLRQEMDYWGKSIQVCHYSSSKNDAAPSYSYSKFIANAGSVLSMLLQGPLLWEFFVQSLTTSPHQQNMVSFSIALLLGNAGMLLDNFGITETFTAFCDFADLVLYFGFLSSFFWISSLAFETSCTVWTIGGGFADLARVNDDKKFWIYSAVNWASPIFIISAMAISGPRFDDGTCAYTGDGVFLLFFAFPLTVTASVNLAFYICSAYVVYTEPKTGEKLSTINFKFGYHAVFVLVANVMWATLLLAAYYHSFVFLVIFTILNVLLGFLAYICSPTENFISKTISKIKEFNTDNVVKEDAN